MTSTEDNFSGKQIYMCYFSVVVEDPQKLLHKCKGCDAVANPLSQDLKRGYRNLVTHVKSVHKADWETNIRKFLKQTSSGPMDVFLRQPTDKAKSIFRWIEWIVKGNLPFSFASEQLTRKNTVLPNICNNTLVYYMKRLSEEVQEIIQLKLPKTFGLVIDGWTVDHSHFNGIFGCYFDEPTDSIREYLLGCNVGEDVDEETEFVDGLDDSDKSFGFTADDWFDVIIDVLWKYEIKHNDEPINADNFNKIIEFITMDNCSTNRALARKSEVPMVGCASHRLHLAVEELEGKKETRNKQGRLTQAADGYRPVTRKLDLLMGELGTLKNSSLVRSKTSLKPERRNATRWYSLFKILVKYKKLKDILPQVQNFPPSVLSLIPNEMEKAKLMELLEDLRKFESVSQMLQNRSQDRPMLCDV